MTYNKEGMELQNLREQLSGSLKKFLQGEQHWSLDEEDW